jgi:hypothetical protein
MKRLWVLAAGVVIFAGVDFAFTQTAEVSQKSDISIFSVYSSEDVPVDAVAYFDGNLIERIRDLGRFNVIGFQYRFDTKSASEFLEKIRELKKEQIFSDERLVDERIGAVVLPAEELYTMLKSVFIFIPSISGWNVSSYEVEVEVKKDGETVIEYRTEHKAEVTVSVQIIDGEGKLRRAYLDTGEETSRRSQEDAYQKAIRSAISGLTFFLRSTDEFRLRTRVLQRDGRNIYLELGKDLGIRKGYEFAMQITSVLEGDFTITKTAGLVRVREVGDNFSRGHVIHGNPQPEDRLIEMPMLDIRFSLFGGFSTMNIRESKFDFVYAEMPDKVRITNITIKQSYLVPDFGFKTVYEIGYAGLAGIKMGFLINEPTAVYIGVGGGYELFFGSVSLDFGADFCLIATSITLGEIAEIPGGLEIGDTIFENDIKVNLSVFTMGINPFLAFNIQLAQKFKLRAYGGFNLYIPPFYSLSFSDVKDSEISKGLSFLKDEVYFIENGDKIDSLPISFTGFFAGIELILRL